MQEPQKEAERDNADNSAIEELKAKIEGLEAEIEGIKKKIAPKTKKKEAEDDTE